jgi:SAM-dependent methyltransferase
MFRGKTEIRDAYRDTGVATQYVDKRFHAPLGAMLHDRQLQLLRRLIAEHQPRRVLEIAPGPARLTVGVAPVLNGSSLTLMDASAQMLTEARRRLGNGRITYVHGDAFSLPFAGHFDLVYTFRLVRHFDVADRLSMLKEIARVTRRGALLVFDAVNRVVSEPLRAAAPEEYKHFDALMNPESIREEIETSGFTLESLVGVQHRYPLLNFVQVYVGPRSPSLARSVMEVVDRSGGKPLEWIVVCRRV